MGRPHIRSLLAVPLILVIALAGTACGTADPTPPAVRKAADPTDDRATEQDRAAAKKAALTAYSAYLAASRKAELAGDPHHPELKKHLADPLLTRVQLAIRDAKEHGAMRTGKLLSDPRVTTISLDIVPATVDIQDCIDATDYRLIFVKDKSVVPGSEAGRYLATATVARYPDGRWLVNDGSAHRDQPC